MTSIVGIAEESSRVVGVREKTFERDGVFVYWFLFDGAISA